MDPERDHCPGSHPVVSIAAGDEADYKRAVTERALARARLVRRDVSHGEWAALRPDGIVPKIQGRKRRVVAWRMRWNAARPIVSHGFLDATEARWLPLASEYDRLFNSLSPALEDPSAGPDILRAALSKRGTIGAQLELADPERDLARLALAGPQASELWAKLGRLSTHPGDRSLRLRLSYGQEVLDDSNPSEARQRLLRDVAAELLPGGQVLFDRARLAPIEEIAEEPLYGTQPIVYWNAPGGGALFHHDAFAGPAHDQQRAVLYTQLTGRTAWLALAITDLALRVREYVSDLDAPNDPAADELGSVRRLCGDWRALVSELGEPGCGRCGPIVNAPAFTAFLADSGHASVLEPGDAIVLPNFGLERTAMHSVFCATDQVSSGVSLALRTDPERKARLERLAQREAQSASEAPGTAAPETAGD